MCQVITFFYRKKLLLRVFALICAKIYVYFSVRTYFFYFTYLLFKIPQIRLSILYYISLKYQIFLIFLIVYLFSHTTIIIYFFFLSFFILGIRKERIKNQMQKINNVDINLHVAKL